MYLLAYLTLGKDRKDCLKFKFPLKLECLEWIQKA